MTDCGVWDVALRVVGACEVVRSWLAVMGCGAWEVALSVDGAGDVVGS